MGSLMVAVRSTLAHRWRRDERAIDPVLATAILILITIVLIAVVILVINNYLPDRPQSAPLVRFEVDDTVDRLKVVKTDRGANWQRLTLTFTGADQAGSISIGTAPFPIVNELAAGGEVANTWDPTESLPLSDTADEIDTSDFLELCGSGLLDNVQFSIIDDLADQSMGSWTFPDVAPC